MKKIIMLVMICTMVSALAQGNSNTVEKKISKDKVELALPKSALCTWEVDVDKTYINLMLAALPKLSPEEKIDLRFKMHKLLGTREYTVKKDSYELFCHIVGLQQVITKFTVTKIVKNVYTLKVGKFTTTYTIKGKTAILETVLANGNKSVIYLIKK